MDQSLCRANTPGFGLSWKVRSLCAGVMVLLLAFSSAGSASAASTANTVIHPVLWGNRCLDSNSVGSVYTLTCNGGNYQYWHGDTNPVATKEIIDYATGRCLETNGAGGVYTSTCNATSIMQRWSFSGLTGLGTIRSDYTGLCLASNSAGQVYAATCAGAGGQTGWWEPSFPFHG
jgi:hypothetical protein